MAGLAVTRSWVGFRDCAASSRREACTRPAQGQQLHDCLVQRSRPAGQGKAKGGLFRGKDKVQ